MATILSNSKSIKQEILEISAKKQKLERDIVSLECSLPPEFRSLRPVDNSVFLDKDGFPRNDVDVLAIKNTRKKLLDLTEEYKKTEQFIELLVRKYYEK